MIDCKLGEARFADSRKMSQTPKFAVLPDLGSNP
jgi:hypothetical protein